MKDRQAVMVMSGHNIRAVIAFCRWAKAHKIEIYIVAGGRLDPIMLTEYREAVSILRDSPELSADIFLAWVRELREKYQVGQLLVLPSSEYLNRFLLKYRQEIEEAQCIVPLVDEKLYSTVSNKESFARLCKAHGLDIPQEFSTLPDRLPFVAKPRRYLSLAGRQLIPQLIQNDSDLDRFRRNESIDDYFLQEFVSGKSLYLLAYIHQDFPDVLYSQENLMQQARGGSIILARRSNFHQSTVAKRYVEMLHTVGFYGLIMIETRFDEVNDRYAMIEANPRLWGPIQFTIDNDIDLFGAMLSDYAFDIRPATDTPRFSDHYFWSGGIANSAQPITYHNYSADQFVENFESLRGQDIFFREDALPLFIQEARGNIR